MKPKFTNKQLGSAILLLKNLKAFVDKKYGAIENCVVMTNPLMKDTILIKYKKDYTTGNGREIEHKLASIPNDGEISFIDDKFTDAFQRAAFISECEELDLENTSSYEKID